MNNSSCAWCAVVTTPPVPRTIDYGGSIRTGKRRSREDERWWEKSWAVGGGLGSNGRHDFRGGKSALQPAQGSLRGLQSQVESTVFLQIFLVFGAPYYLTKGTYNTICLDFSLFPLCPSIPSFQYGIVY